jgi:fructosamine-3-kinase
MEQIIRNIVKKECNSELLQLRNVSLGWSGSSVYIAELHDGNKIIVKTASSEPEAPFGEEQDTKRVYSGRFSDIEPVYHLLLEKNIRVPKLLAKGTEEGISYVVMECLEGDTKVPQLMVAEELGKLHSISRDYQGSVSLQRPYAKSWKDAFFSAIRAQLSLTASLSGGVQKMLPSINSFINEKESQWQDPSRFVLSHADGFQGLAKRRGETYEFTGVIDLEDHQFTDPRFTLAGYQLFSERYAHEKLSQEFWDIYKTHAAIEASYENFRALFQLYYLLEWLFSCFKRTDDPKMATIIPDTERLIGVTIAEN